jgi:hypothetical protein
MQTILEDLGFGALLTVEEATKDLKASHLN